MSINEDYSLVRYNPHQGMLGHRTAGSTRPSPGRACAAARHPESTGSTFMAGGSLRQGQLHLIYSLGRTIETDTAGGIGQNVDIFV